MSEGLTSLRTQIHGLNSVIKRDYNFSLDIFRVTTIPPPPRKLVYCFCTVHCKHLNKFMCNITEKKCNFTDKLKSYTQCFLDVLPTTKKEEKCHILFHILLMLLIYF